MTYEELLDEIADAIENKRLEVAQTRLDTLRDLLMVEGLASDDVPSRATPGDRVASSPRHK